MISAEWLTLPALAAFIVAIIAIGKPIVALNTTMLKLSLAVESLQKTVELNQKLNDEAHDLMFQRLRLHDETISELRGKLIT